MNNPATQLVNAAEDGGGNGRLATSGRHPRSSRLGRPTFGVLLGHQEFSQHVEVATQNRKLHVTAESPFAPVTTARQSVASLQGVDGRFDSRIGVPIDIAGHRAENFVAHLVLRHPKSTPIKSVTINYLSGISMCSDLAKQDWSPSFHLGGKFWGVDGLWAMWPTNAEKHDTARSGQDFYVYGTWWTHGKRFRVSLSPGETKPDFGFTHPSLWFKTENQPHSILSMDPGHMYDFDTYPESPDLIDARTTRRVACLEPEVKYSGAWSVVEAVQVSPARYEGKAKSASEAGASLEFTFRGKEIFWRALKGPKQGKADVYLDGAWQATVDCSASHPLIYQFSFIKQNIPGPGPHTIKVVAKGEKGHLASDTAITHLEFEEGLR